METTLLRSQSSSRLSAQGVLGKLAVCFSPVSSVLFLFVALFLLINQIGCAADETKSAHIM